jgi:hypothetical protein
MSNMAIWNAVSKTNPADTKQVSQRGGFTSICAQSQFRSATEQFGPIGQGWGYSAAAPIFHDRLVFVQVSLWHGDRSNSFGPMTGGAEWQDKNGRPDSDAVKKATTDAITKLLSQLGFNADVFLGLYDDSKYVQEVAKEFAPKPAVISEDQATELEALMEGLNFPVARLLDVSKIQNLKQLRADKFEGAKGWINQEAAKMDAAKKAKEAA